MSFTVVGLYEDNDQVAVFHIYDQASSFDAYHYAKEHFSFRMIALFGGELIDLLPSVQDD